MVNWIEKFQGDELWTHIQNSIDMLDEFRVENESYREQAYTMRHVLGSAIQLRDLAPEFVSSQKLEAARIAAGNVEGGLRNWTTGSGEEHIEHTYLQNFPTLQDALLGWPLGTAGDLRSAAATLRESVKALQHGIDSFQGLAKDNQSKLEQLITEKREEAEAWLTEFDREYQFNTAKLRQEVQSLGANIANLENVVSQNDQRNSKLIESLQNQFTSAEEVRQSAHQDLISEHGNRLNKLLSNADQRISEYRETQEASFQESKKRVDQLEKNIADIVGAVGTAATANWYKTHADAQRDSADNWSKLALAGFAAAFIVIAVSLFLLPHEDDSWKTTILKSTATVTLVAAAGYAARESSKHRTEEFQSRKVELTLRAFDPFIATLHRNERTALKRDAAKSVFAIVSAESEAILESEEDEDDQIVST